MLQARLPLEPLARPRQAHRVVMPKGGARPFVQSYTPEDGKFAGWRQAAILLLRAARRGAPALTGPLGIRLVCLFKMPAGEHRVRDPRPRRWHTSKPDADNVLKAVMDAMVEAGWLADDAPVAQVEVQKIVAAQGEAPSIHVTLAALPPMAAPTALEFKP